MTLKQKQKFVRELIGRVRDDVLKVLPKTPEEWDGFELRWLIADHFCMCKIDPMGGDEGRQRKREYSNEVLVRNLV